MGIVKVERKRGTILIELEDYESIIAEGWRLGIIYINNRYLLARLQKGAHRDGNQVVKTLSRHLLKAPENLMVDHIDGNPLNNLRSNLRLVTSAQNQMNRKCITEHSSKFKGVRYHSRDKRWTAQIQYNQKNIWLGYHNDETSAAKAYDKKALELFGEFARINL